jgi:hypothetical protein
MTLDNVEKDIFALLLHWLYQNTIQYCKSMHFTLKQYRGLKLTWEIDKVECSVPPLALAKLGSSQIDS